MLTPRRDRVLSIGAVAVVIAGGAFGSAASGKTNARSTSAAGGALATVGTVSKSSFTATTSAGQKVTVKKSSTTTYKNGTSAASASAVTKGAPFLVLGKVNSTTITATQVVVNPANTGSGTTFTRSPVVAFKRGTKTASKQDGKVPSTYKEGSGTIVKATTANKATTAALAAYPGGVIDRVVKLSNGDYEIHTIGVNWPHHIFADKGLKIIGAN